MNNLRTCTIPWCEIDGASPTWTDCPVPSDISSMSAGRGGAHCGSSGSPDRGTRAGRRGMLSSSLTGRPLPRPQPPASTWAPTWAGSLRSVEGWSGRRWVLPTGRCLWSAPVRAVRAFHIHPVGYFEWDLLLDKFLSLIVWRGPGLLFHKLLCALLTVQVPKDHPCVNKSALRPLPSVFLSLSQ